MRMLLLHFLYLTLVWSLGLCLPLDGCPMWGCRTSGSFSFNLDFPKSGVTTDWVSNFFIDPVPNPRGCVGNSESLVCQSNGPGPADTSYMGINAEDGKVTWRDKILRFPTLPVMDAYGDVWGSDGNQVEAYDVTGKPMGPAIPLAPKLRPLFDMQIIESNILLTVSENGQISMLETDGTPFATLVLHSTVGGDNGTFHPVAPPVVNANRFYVITEFSPDNKNSTHVGLQRLFAIETHHSVGDMVRIAWYTDFKKAEQAKQMKTPHKQRSSPHRRRKAPSSVEQAPSGGFQRLVTKPGSVSDSLHLATLNASLLWDVAGQMLFVSLPSPMLVHQNVVVVPEGRNCSVNKLQLRPSGTTPTKRAQAAPWAHFFGIKDNGNGSAIVFQSDTHVVAMALYERNEGVPKIQDNGQSVPNVPNADTQVWVSLPDGTLQSITQTGQISRVINLPKMMNVTLTITSKLMVVRTNDMSEDCLVFGIHVTSKSDTFIRLARKLSVTADADNYVIGYYGSETKTLSNRIWSANSGQNSAFLRNSSKIHNQAGVTGLWMVPTPDDKPAVGQIVGVAGDENGNQDRIVAFAQDQAAGKLFSIVGKP